MTSYYRDPNAPEPNTPRRVGVTAVVERDGLVLVDRRIDDPDRWAFLGGNVEEAESVLDALAREVREETAFTIERSALLGIFSDPSRIVAYPDGTVVRFISLAFRVQPVERTDPVPSEESAGLRFVTHRELEELDLWPAHLPIRDTYLARRDDAVVA